MSTTGSVTDSILVLENAKERISEKVRQWETRLLSISHDIHSHPELAFQEHRAARLLAEALLEAGFDTTVGVYGLETAIEASYGSGDFVVTVCAEYDALPSIGHGCGHNIIAAAGLGAAIALASIADEIGIRVKLLGTPAEESGGGKVTMLENGAWSDSTVSLMVHGAPGIDMRCSDYRSQAVDRFEVTYTGLPSHAAGAPQAGINALDAATIALAAIGLSRQQLPNTVRVAAFITEGGEATNIIPSRTVLQAEVRSFELAELDDAKRKVMACFEAGAIASGCSWEQFQVQPRYEPLRQEPLLATAWDTSVSGLGRTPIQVGSITGGSTDMGNVSQGVPSIHPAIGISGTTAAPHTAGFTEAAAGEGADQAIVDAAQALAWTAATVAINPEVRAELLARQDERTGD
ncbi:amidohydrolase [Paenarthrobacter sp. NPDC058040]|uniref:amidohydrolase n=1 Tax=unclassified Paenarthrobacter TaxID=2634190 RepID=UPI0036D9FC21